MTLGERKIPTISADGQFAKDLQVVGGHPWLAQRQRKRLPNSKKTFVQVKFDTGRI